MCTYNRHATNKIGYTLVINYQVIPAENLSEIPMSLCMRGDYVIILVHHKDILINVYNDNYVVLCIGCITCIYVPFSEQLLHFCAQTHSCKVAKASLQGM